MLKKKSNTVFFSNTHDHELSENSNAFANEDLNQLYDAIKKLSEVDRGVILLYLEEKSYKEIAEIMEVSIKTIEKRIHNALVLIRSEIVEAKKYV